MCRTSVMVVLAWIWMISAAQAYRYTHVVLPGENISAIAKHYHVTPRQLKRQNRLRGPNLRAGQKLRIKTAVPCRPIFKTKYTIKRGDSLSRIAKKLKMSLALLRRLNPRVKGRLRAGQSLWVVTAGPRPEGVGGLYHLTDGPGYRLASSPRSWGTFLAITRLMEVLADHGRAFPRAEPIVIGDLSRKGGGFLAPHKSHRRGRDVDVRFPLRIKTERYVAATPETLDLKRTWDLIQRFIRTGDVVYVFVDYRLQRKIYNYVKDQKRLSKKQLAEYFQYPRGSRSMVGIVRHEPGHATHMHIRFVREQRPAPPSS